MRRFYYGLFFLSLLCSCSKPASSFPFKEDINPLVVLGHAHKTLFNTKVPENITLITFVPHDSPLAATTFSDKIYLMNQEDLREVLNKSEETSDQNIRKITIDKQTKKVWIYKAGESINNYALNTNNPIESLGIPLQGRCNSMMKTGLFDLPLDPKKHSLFFAANATPSWKTHSSETYCYKYPKPDPRFLEIFPDAIIKEKTELIEKARKGSRSFGKKDNFSLKEIFDELKRNNPEGKEIILFYGACRS